MSRICWRSALGAVSAMRWVLNRAARVQSALCFYVRFMRLSGIGESPQAARPSIHGNVSPNGAVSPIYRHAHREPRGFVTVRSPAVLRVGLVRHVAQIGKAVVRWVAVDVVYIAIRPSTCHHEPGNAMRVAQNAVNLTTPRRKRRGVVNQLVQMPPPPSRHVACAAGKPLVLPGRFGAGGCARSATFAAP